MHEGVFFFIASGARGSEAVLSPRRHAAFFCRKLVVRHCAGCIHICKIAGCILAELVLASCIVVDRGDRVDRAAMIDVVFVACKKVWCVGGS